MLTNSKCCNVPKLQITNYATFFYSGQKIPRIDYTEDEIKTWSAVYKTVAELVPKHACKEYQRAFKVMEAEGIISDNEIAQLEDVSNFLRRETGFSLRPAAGLLTARDFLASLAFRIFQSTQYIRHPKTPMHTPEP